MQVPILHSQNTHQYVGVRSYSYEGYPKLGNVNHVLIYPQNTYKSDGDVGNS